MVSKGRLLWISHFLGSMIVRADGNSTAREHLEEEERLMSKCEAITLTFQRNPN